MLKSLYRGVAANLALSSIGIITGSPFMVDHPISPGFRLWIYFCVHFLSVWLHFLWTEAGNIKPCEKLAAPTSLLLLLCGCDGSRDHPSVPNNPPSNLELEGVAFESLVQEYRPLSKCADIDWPDTPLCKLPCKWRDERAVKTLSARKFRTES